MNYNLTQSNTIILEKTDNMIKNFILKGIFFLKKNQLGTGEFKTYVSLQKEMTNNCYCYLEKSPYITTYILYSINFLSHSIVEAMTQKALSFLLEEMKYPGLWSFFNSKKIDNFNDYNRKKIGLIPDLDDTACVSYILLRNNILFDDNREFFLKNRNERGIFYTWLLDNSKWKDEKDTAAYIIPSKNDVCCGVNANVLLYLGEDHNTTNVCEYLNNVVFNNEEEICNLYFTNQIAFYYILSRAYFNGVHSLKKSKKNILSKIMSIQKDDGSFGSVLDTAFSICIMLNFAELVPSMYKSIEYIVNAQYENGSWSKSAFFIDSSRYFGSEELTTAICIEALVRYSLLKEVL